MFSPSYRGRILTVALLLAGIPLLLTGHVAPSIGLGALGVSWLVQLFYAIVAARQERSDCAVPPALIEHLSDWAVAVDDNGIVRYISQSVRQYGGDADLIGMPWTNSAMAGQDPFYVDLIKSVMPGSPSVAGPVSGEVAVPRGDRRVFEAITYRTEQQGHTCTVCLFRDVTDKRRLQGSMVAIDRLATVAQLATGVAHDFNNVLGGIMLNTGLLVTAEGADREHLSARIMAGAERGALLCRRLLTFARGETLGTAPVPVTPLLAEVVSLFDTEAHRHGVTVTWTADPETLVTADRGQLQQLLLDLLLYARLAIGSGGTIALRAEDQGEEVRVDVRHSGPAIPPEALPFIFLPFFGADDGKPTGAWIRLAVCQRLTSGMGGRLEVESHASTGTTFALILPSRGISQNSGSSLEASL